MIDRFFESLKFEALSRSDDPVEVSEVNYGELMHMVATDSRYVYKGSLTTPPCTESIYWNVVTKVYPIKREHLDAFRALWQKSEHITY